MDNVLLTPGAQGAQPQGGVVPSPNQKVEQILDQLEKAGSDGGPGQAGMDRSKRIQTVAAQIPQVMQAVTDEFLKGELDKLHYMATMAVDKRSEGDGDWRQKLAEIRGYLQSQNNTKTAGGKHVEFNWERHAQELKETREFATKKKKKTKGNPFKVLMGQVGKLLDHGVAKPAIVRHLSKNSKFDEETIDRAVDIVKEYNRKKQTKEETEQEAPADIADAGHDTESMVVNEPIEDEREAGFNYQRWVEAQRVKAEARGLYEAAPQWEKRSTAELFARLQWLNSLESYGKTTPQGDGKAAASKASVNSEINAITSELSARGFNQEEIRSLLR